MTKHSHFAPQGNAKNPRKQAAALMLSLLAGWRLPDALGLGAASPVIVGQGISFVLVAALYYLFRAAFRCGDQRLKRISYGIGLIFAAFTVIGEKLDLSGSLDAFSWGGLLDGLFLTGLFAVVYGAALLLIFRGVEGRRQRAIVDKPESLLSRVLGNGLVLTVFFMLCWLPVWLAFWPGSFSYDSVTQFYTYMDWMHSSHHPLLHTLLLGFLMFLGIDNTADGSAAVGLAVYSVVQMLLMAGMMAYACHWLRRKKAPVYIRVFITLFFALFPFYSLWSFNAQKDVLFGGLVMLLSLELIDVWENGYALLRSPLRIVKFVLISVLMMLMRNNGVYALVLVLPFAVIWAKGARLRVLALLVGCIAAYFLANHALVLVTEAEPGETVEMMSIPLQQIARTLRDFPEAAEEDEDAVLETLYGDLEYVSYYEPIISDPVKWAMDSELLDENMPDLLSLWARLAPKYLKSYAEAFLVQNLPYFLPGAEKHYFFDVRIVQIDIFPIEAHSYIPELRPLYETYDQTLTFLGLPWVRPLSDTAVYVWLCIAGFGFALYRKERKWLAGFGLLLGVWATCLLGPGGIVRYMLCFFYAVPVILAAMLAPPAKALAEGVLGADNDTVKAEEKVSEEVKENAVSNTEETVEENTDEADAKPDEKSVTEPAEKPDTKTTTTE